MPRAKGRPEPLVLPVAIQGRRLGWLRDGQVCHAGLRPVASSPVFARRASAEANSPGPEASPRIRRTRFRDGKDCHAGLRRLAMTDQARLRRPARTDWNGLRAPSGSDIRRLDRSARSRLGATARHQVDERKTEEGDRALDNHIGPKDRPDNGGCEYPAKC